MNRLPALLLVALLCSPCLADEPAELILTGGVVHTLEAEAPTASVVAMRGGRIVGVGDAVDPAWRGPKTRVVELAGACVVPGLWDAHAHLRGLGASRRRVNLRDATSFAEVVERVRARAAQTPKGEWVMGSGWDQNDWPQAEFGGEFPVHDALSKAVPEHPVLLRRIDGHAALLNAKALALCGVTAETKAPAGGAIPRDAKGAPTGVLVDAAMAFVKSPAVSDAEVSGALTLAAQECLALGLVGVHDAGVSTQTLAAYQRLYAEGALPFRVYAMLQPGATQSVPRPLINAFGGLFTVRAIKRFMDGALGSRGAALLAPYSDAPDTRGLPQQDVEALATATAEALSRGFQTCTHAIGDAGVRRVLDAYERAQKGDTSRRLRVEHAQVIALEDIPRFAALGVLPSFQPTHATSDMPWAEARLGPKRVKGAYAWRRLKEAGMEHLPLGSDFPVEEPNPLLGIYAAVTRLSPQGESPHGEGGWYPDQRLTRLEALRGFTIDAAYAAFQEQDSGSIAVGKWADVAVFDRDLLTCAPPELLSAKVRLTVVAGKIVYEAN